MKRYFNVRPWRTNQLRVDRREVWISSLYANFPIFRINYSILRTFIWFGTIKLTKVMASLSMAVACDEIRQLMSQNRNNLSRKIDGWQGQHKQSTRIWKCRCLFRRSANGTRRPSIDSLLTFVLLFCFTTSNRLVNISIRDCVDLPLMRVSILTWRI